jgi:hypothetical protein
MARHAELALLLAGRIFFTDPASPWQRGTNENTTGLLRQYFPTSITAQVAELSYPSSRDITDAVFCQGPYDESTALPRPAQLGPSRPHHS